LCLLTLTTNLSASSYITSFSHYYQQCKVSELTPVSTEYQ